MRLGCGSYQWVLIAALLMNGVVGTNDAGKKFLEANKAKEGVLVLPSGLQYKVRTLRCHQSYKILHQVLRGGEGGFHPTADSPCACHYKGTLIDGSSFDSSYDRGEPTTFAPNQVIKVRAIKTCV